MMMKEINKYSVGLRAPVSVPLKPASPPLLHITDLPRHSLLAMTMNYLADIIIIRGNHANSENTDCTYN